MKLPKLLFLAVICLIISANYAFSEYIFAPSEYSVYSIVLDKWFSNGQRTVAVLRGRTALGCSRENIRQELTFVSRQMAGLCLETINDFIAKNLDSYPLDHHLSKDVPYTIISSEEINAIFRYEDGWKRFYERYPNSKGILTFSRVGFDFRCSQALVYLSSQWGNFSGAGVYILLDRDSQGVWNIKQVVRAWHSWLPPEENLSFPAPHGELQPVL